MRRIGVMALMAILAIAQVSYASAQPAPEGPVIGDIPAPNTPALLVAGEAQAPDELVAALDARGCNVAAVGVLVGGNWLMYIVGAPAQVNAGFPDLTAQQPFWVRCGEGGTVSIATVTGTVTYLERIALPPDAVVTVTLLDISQQDVAATTIATTEITTGGAQVPIPFTLEYNTQDIVPTNTYGVRADITVGGSPMFVTDTATPVITQGNPTTNVELTLKSATGGEISPIVGQNWDWVSTLKGSQENLPNTAGDTVLVLSPDGSASAATDCNTFGGEYTLDGSNISIEFMIQTLIACPPGSNEEEFIADVESATSFSVSEDGNTLTLTLPGTGNSMRFRVQ